MRISILIATILGMVLTVVSNHRDQKVNNYTNHYTQYTMFTQKLNDAIVILEFFLLGTIALSVVK